MGKYKYNKEKAMGSILELHFALLMEAMEFTKAEENDTIIDLDVRAFYNHCYEKYFERLVDRNYHYLQLDKEYTLWTLNCIFLTALNNISLYNVAKLEMLKMSDEFIERYRNYLNDGQEAVS